MTKEAKPQRPTTIRLDTEVRDRLDEFCATTRRTLNAAVNLLIDQALNDITFSK